MPASVNDAPAGDAERRLLEALAWRYADAEFTARAAADLSPTLWDAAGVACPDAGSVGRWLRVRKGAVAGFALGNRKNRDGVSLWRLRRVEPRKADSPIGLSQAEAIPRGPAPAVFREPPENPPIAAPRAPWWAVPPPPPQSTPGGAAEHDGGASWWANDGGAP